MSRSESPKKRGDVNAVLEELTTHKDGDFKPTSNGLGFQYATFEPWEQDNAWAKYAGENTDKGAAADIGSAFGAAGRLALAAGVKRLLAVDLDQKHHDAFAQSLSDEDRKRVDFILGSFPRQIKLKIASKSLVSINLSNVLIFLDPTTIKEAASLLADVVVPKGRVYISNVSQHGMFGKLTERYKQQVKAKHEFPGFMDKAVVDALRKDVPKLNDMYVHPTMFLLSPEQVDPLLANAGFKILLSELTGRQPSAIHVADVPSDDTYRGIAERL